MLNANLLLFSRTLARDYRWIYFDNRLGQAGSGIILSDYKEFEHNKNFFLNEAHLFVRRVKQGIALYKFIETKYTDQNSRKIFALIGCSFSEYDYDIVHALLQYVAAYFFINGNMFEKFQDNIQDTSENLFLSIEFALDTIIDSYRTTSVIRQLADDIGRLLNQYPGNSFVISSNGIQPIISGTNISHTSESHCGQKIDDLLNNINNTRNNTSTSKPLGNTPIKETTQHSSLFQFFKTKKN